MWVNGNDVYIGAREALHVFRVSLHQSDIWRIAWVADLDRPDSESDRVIVKWTRPNQFAPGWTPSIGIFFSSIRPSRPLRPLQIDDDRLTWFSPPSESKSLLFKVLLSQSEFTENDLRRVTREQDRLAARMVKKNGEIVWLVTREEDLTEPERRQIDKYMSNTRIQLKSTSSENALRALRILVVASEDHRGWGHNLQFSIFPWGWRTSSTRPKHPN
jgi:hypothetical protein